MITDSDPEVQDKLGPYSVIISFSALFKKKKKGGSGNLLQGGKKPQENPFPLKGFPFGLRDLERTKNRSFRLI